MARLNNGVSIMLAALVITVILFSGGAHSKSQDQWYMDFLPKNVTEFFDNCTNHMALDCAEEVINAMLTKGPVSDVCCCDLVLMGIECHTSLVKLFVNLPAHKKNAGIINGNSRRVFDECVAIDKERRYGKQDRGLAPSTTILP